MKVTIDIKGNAIVYSKGNWWHIVLITDESHRALISDNLFLETPNLPKSVKPDSGVRNMTVALQLDPLDPRDPTVPVFGSGIDNILNMHNDALHGTANGDAVLVETGTAGPGRQIVHIRVPLGTLSSNGRTRDYWITRESRGNPAEPLDHYPKPVAEYVTIEFELRPFAGPALALRSDKKTDRVKEIGWDSNTNGINILIDNDCHGENCKQTNDFANYYDWLYDPSGKRFLAGKVKKLVKKARDVRGESGNCEPVTVIPHPKP